VRYEIDLAGQSDQNKKGRQMFEELGLSATPTFYVIKGDRKVRYEGPLDPRQIAQFIADM
jgi:protein-disulfide isomerase